MYSHRQVQCTKQRICTVIDRYTVIQNRGYVQSQTGTLYTKQRIIKHGHLYKTENMYSYKQVHCTKQRICTVINKDTVQNRENVQLKTGTMYKTENMYSHKQVHCTKQKMCTVQMASFLLIQLIAVNTGEADGRSQLLA